MLSDITKAFEERNPGVASFETFAAQCMDEVRNDPDNASIYLMLGLTAKQFYDQFSDRPVTVELANQRKDRMLSLAQEAVGALEASADGKYGVANRIAIAGFGAAD